MQISECLMVYIATPTTATSYHNSERFKGGIPELSVPAPQLSTGNIAIRRNRLNLYSYFLE
jgi:hypothetical protein